MKKHDKANNADRRQVSSLTRLPDDILYDIFAFCEVHGLLTLELVCKRLYDAIHTHQAWFAKLRQLDHIHAPDIPTHVAVELIPYVQLRRTILDSVHLFDAIAATSPRSLVPGTLQAGSSVAADSSHHQQPEVSAEDERTSDVQYRRRCATSLHPPSVLGPNLSRYRHLARRGLTVRKATLAPGGRYLFVVWASWAMFRRTDHVIDIIDLKPEQDNSPSSNDCFPVPEQASASASMREAKVIWRHSLTEEDMAKGADGSTTVMEHGIYLANEDVMMVTVRIYNPQLNEGRSEVFRLKRSRDNGTWETAAKLLLGRYDYSCTSPHFAVFFRNDAIAIVRWNDRRDKFENIELPCEVFTNQVYADILADRLFYVKLDQERCLLRSFSLTEAFQIAEAYASKHPHLDGESMLRVPCMLEDCLGVSSLLVDPPGHVADIKFSVYTSPETTHSSPPTFQSPASVFILVLVRPEPQSAPAYFIALHASFTPSIPPSDRWCMLSRSERRIHPEFAVDGMYLYVELLSRMSKRGWLLVNLMKRLPDRAGFQRVQALVALAPAAAVPCQKLSSSSTCMGTSDVGRDESDAVSIVFPRLPEQLREHYLMNIPLKATEGVENFLEEYSGALLYISTKDAPEGEGTNLVEVWYPYHTA